MLIKSNLDIVKSPPCVKPIIKKIMNNKTRLALIKEITINIILRELAVKNKAFLENISDTKVQKYMFLEVD